LGEHLRVQRTWKLVLVHILALVLVALDKGYVLSAETAGAAGCQLDADLLVDHGA